LGMPMIALMYMGRLFNLTVWLCLIYMAIRIAPILKWSLLLLALTPTSLFQASSLSADVLTNGLSILLIALFLKCAYDEKDGKAALFYIFCVSILVSISKLYFLLVFLFLLVPSERVGGRRKYLVIFLSLLGLTVFSLLLWSYYAKDLYVHVRASASLSDQLRYIIQNPIRYITVMYKTTLIQGRDYLITFVGRLGHFPLNLPTPFVVFHTVVLLFVASIDSNENVVMHLKDKTKLVAIFLLSFFWVLTTQYLSWTVVGANIIEGVSGRYFIPIAPIIFLLPYNRKIKLDSDMQKIHTVLVCYASLILTYAAYFILKGYY